jgi:dTDP-glucose 4,6-dehydratase
VETYGSDVLVTRCTNNYGPYQFPEKIIPLFVTTLMGGGKVPLYGDGLNERDWLYVEDHCAALHLLVDDGKAGTIYNIGAGEQRTNIDLTHAILAALDLGDDRIEFVPDRLGHDRRYAVDSARLRSLGWEPEHDFDDGLSSTIAWYQSREDWWRPLMEGNG